MMRVAPVVSLPAGFDGSLPHHEAGHAVVAIALGLPCHGAQVLGHEGRCALYDALDAQHEPLLPPAPPGLAASVHVLAARVHIGPSADDKNRALAMGAMLMAGRQAELLHAGLKLDGCLWIDDHDMQTAMHLLAPHFGAGSAPVWRCQQEARRQLSQNWAAVQAIAEELAVRGRWLCEPQFLSLIAAGVGGAAAL